MRTPAQRIILALAFFSSMLTANAKVFFIADHDVAALKAAIVESNTNNQPDTIYLALNGHYVLSQPIASFTDGNSGLPDVALDNNTGNSIVVYANGASLERDAGASSYFRIWMVSTGVLEIHDAVIKNGKLNGAPGQNGGGIASYGLLSMFNSTFADNTATFQGGALYLSLPATSITNCTFTGNQSGFGGAIYFYSTNAVIANCTISKNRTTAAGGKAVQNILNADDPNQRVFIRNSIIANNIDKNNAEADVSGILISLGHNLIGENSDPNTIAYLQVGTPNNVGDNVGTAAAPVDPLLNDLAMNGGLTPTMTISSANSLAFNAGGSAANAPATDQAGNNRIGSPETGSMEFNNNPILNPGISLKTGSTSFANGSIYDVGTVAIGDPLDILFTIGNTGFAQKLNLLSHPLIFSSNETDFQKDERMTSGAIAGNDATTFGLRISPAKAGMTTTTLSIASNDTNTPAFTLTVRAMATSPVDISLSASAQSPVCEKTPATITVYNTEPGVDYSALIDGVTASATVAGGGDILLTVAAEKLSVGSNAIQILANRPGAGQGLLTVQPGVVVLASTVITLQPANATEGEGENTILSIEASGSSLTYQWKKENESLFDGSSIAGTKTSILTLNDLRASSAGSYSCEVAGDCGVVQSSAARVIVTPVATVTGISEGTDLSFYPNPATSKIHVRNETGFPQEISLLDARGFFIKQWRITDVVDELSVDDISSGLYLLRCESNGNVHLFRIMIE